MFSLSHSGETKSIKIIIRPVIVKAWGEEDGIDLKRMQGTFGVIKIFYILSIVVVP